MTDQIADVRLLLAPLALEDIKTVRCLGLNYEQHAKEVGSCEIYGRRERRLTAYSPTCQSRNIPYCLYVGQIAKRLKSR